MAVRGTLLGVGIVAMALLATGCGNAPSDATSTDSRPPTTASAAPGTLPATSVADLPFGLERSEILSWIPATSSYYRDQPVYVANEQPTRALRAWARKKPGFEDIWIDRDHNGWVSLGFTEGAAERQAELEEEFPDVGVVAVELTYGKAELRQLLDDVLEATQVNDLPLVAGYSVSVPSGMAEVAINVLTEENLAPLAQFAGRPVCFDGLDPEDAVVDGPQPTNGNGWRLLVVDRTGEAYRTGVASNERQYKELWARSGVTAERPPVDFANEIAIWFGAVYGSGCEIRMDDVVVDLDRSIVHGDFVMPGNPLMCPADANPEAYIISIERGRLPHGPFSIQLDADDPPGGVPEERTVVDADLSVPGSIASAGEIGTDPSLFGEANLGNAIAAGAYLEPGYGATYQLDLNCTFERLGPFNGVVWQSVNTNISDEPPAAWLEAAKQGQLLTDVELKAEPPRLSVSANGHSEDYVPVPPDSESDCP